MRKFSFLEKQKGLVIALFWFNCYWNNLQRFFFCSGFSDVEGDIKICICVWNWHIYHSLIFLCKGYKCQVINSEHWLQCYQEFFFSLPNSSFKKKTLAIKAELCMINFLFYSFISVMFYVGLVYLALIFLYRTLICR